MKNRTNVINRLKNECTKTANVLIPDNGIHFGDLEQGSHEGYVMNEVLLTKLSTCVLDLVNEQVLSCDQELMLYSLDMQVELEDNCPFQVWKVDLKQFG